MSKEGSSVKLADLVLVAACLQSEKWRFTYGRKLTPSRIAGFRVPAAKPLKRLITKSLGICVLLSRPASLHTRQQMKSSGHKIRRLSVPKWS